MGLHISALSYALPERIVSNEEIAAALGRWSAAEILAKTGIAQRHVVREGECASDLVVAAARQLLDMSLVNREEIDFLFLVTQSPDYYLPTTACLVQSRLALRNEIAAYDINLGCSGFVYALATANAWIEAGLGRCGLILTGDTYSRFIRPGDSATRPIFGDAGTATVVRAGSGAEHVDAFVFGTDGSGGERLLVHDGGLRHPVSADGGPHLSMDGASIFTFTLDAVPQAVAECLRRSKLDASQVDLFLLHQANAFMLRHLTDKMKLPPEKTPIRMEKCANTVSSTLPILLADLATEKTLRPNMKLMLVGFGVGFSWAACMLELGVQMPTAITPYS